MCDVYIGSLAAPYVLKGRSSVPGMPMVHQRRAAGQDWTGILAQRRHDLGEQSVEYRLLVGACGGGQEDEVTRACVVEVLQRRVHFACGPRDGHAVDQRPEVLVVGPAHGAGNLFSGGFAVRVDVEESPHAPLEAHEVATGLGGAPADRRYRIGVPAR